MLLNFKEKKYLAALLHKRGNFFVKSVEGFGAMLKRWSTLAAIGSFFVSLSAQAILIDFTDGVWDDALNGTLGTVSYGDLDVTVEASTWLSGYLTFNGSASERAGCELGQSVHGLACDGDGIGVASTLNHYGAGDADEIDIYDLGYITVSFSQTVNIDDVYLLDLFASEGSGEVAVINGTRFGGSYSDNQSTTNLGGFWDTGFTAQGVTSIVLRGNWDLFSDYALAGVEVSAVPLPGSLVMFGSGLFLLGMVNRKKKSVM